MTPTDPSDRDTYTTQIHYGLGDDEHEPHTQTNCWCIPLILTDHQINAYTRSELADLLDQYFRIH